MTAIHETAYPRLKNDLKERHLIALYTPEHEEIALAGHVSQGTTAEMAFLLLLKTFQNLGYFVKVSEIPLPIVRHIVDCLRLEDIPKLAGYDDSGTRQRHIKVIRGYLKVTPYNVDMQRHLRQVLMEVAQTKDEPADLINVDIEELLRLRYELPAFRTLRDMAHGIRAKVNRDLYQKVYSALNEAACAQLDKLFVVETGTGFTPWNTLREDTGKPSLSHFREFEAFCKRLLGYNPTTSALLDIPDVKLKHLAAEAKTLDAARLARMKNKKKPRSTR